LPEPHLTGTTERNLRPSGFGEYIPYVTAAE